MFEDIEALWESYVAKHSPSWPAGDSRHDLASEVVVWPTGESRPAEESIDQGLYLHARELHDDVLARLSRGLK